MPLALAFLKGHLSASCSHEEKCPHCHVLAHIDPTDPIFILTMNMVQRSHNALLIPLGLDHGLSNVMFRYSLKKSNIITTNQILMGDQQTADEYNANE
jgi:hypothetical protein